jgi:hypothetical protein
MVKLRVGPKVRNQAVLVVSARLQAKISSMLRVVTVATAKIAATAIQLTALMAATVSVTAAVLAIR